MVQQRPLVIGSRANDALPSVRARKPKRSTGHRRCHVNASLGQVSRQKDTEMWGNLHQCHGVTKIHAFVTQQPRFAVNATSAAPNHETSLKETKIEQ